MFDIQSIQTNSAHPTFLAILISVVLSIVLSSLIVITYDFTTKSLERNHHFLQSLAMISVLAAMVMQAVGDSLARGLGMLGALAVIRFRTTLRDPRNMTFMFASLAVGISCGALGYTIATVGTLAFCLMAVVLKFSPFGKYQALTGELKVTAFLEDSVSVKVEKIIKEFTQSFVLTEYRTRDRTVTLETEYNEYGKKVVTSSEDQRLKELNYDINLKRGVEDRLLIDRLSEEPFVSEVRLRFTRRDNEL